MIFAAAGGSHHFIEGETSQYAPLFSSGYNVGGKTNVDVVLAGGGTTLLSGLIQDNTDFIDLTTNQNYSGSKTSEDTQYFKKNIELLDNTGGITNKITKTGSEGFIGSIEFTGDVTDADDRGLDIRGKHTVAIFIDSETTPEIKVNSAGVEFNSSSLTSQMTIAETNTAGANAVINKEYADATYSIGLGNTDSDNADNGTGIITSDATIISAFEEDIVFEWIPAQSTTVLKFSDLFNTRIDDIELIAGGVFDALDEGNGLGYRLKEADAANYGNLGSRALDLSQSPSASSTYGATGDVSLAGGYEVTSSGYSSFVWGANSTATANFGTTFGQNSTNSSQFSIVSGYGHSISGNYNSSFGASNEMNGWYGSTNGIGLINRSISNHVVGQGNVDYTLNLSLTNLDQPKFIVGNGSVAAGTPNSVSSRSDAFIVRLSGAVEAPSLTDAIIASSGNQSLITLGYFNANAGGGGGGTKYSETFGDGVATTIAITHSLGTEDLSSVRVVNIATKERFYPTEIGVDSNTINLVFVVAPATNEYRVTITA
jgi:hypothetical protein